MKLRKILSIILGVISVTSVILTSAIPDSPDCFKQELPFYIVGIVAGILAIVLHYWMTIRRITYPAIICMMAWLYEHKLARSKFSSHTYRVYVYYGESYATLYSKVQGAFDQYAKEATEV